MRRGYRIPGRVWALAALSAIVLLVVVAVISISGDYPILFLGTVHTTTLAQNYDGAESVTASLVVHSGDVLVGSGAPGALSATINTTYEGDNPDLTYIVDDGQGTLHLVQPPRRDLILLGGQRLNSWDVQLGEAVPLALAVEVGAGYLDLDARRLPLTALDITTNSADLVLDVRGGRAHDLTVTIQAGQGDLTLRLPEQIGVRVLADVRPARLDAGDLARKDDGSLVNAAYGVTPVTLTVALTSVGGRITLRCGYPNNAPTVGLFTIR